MKPEDRVESREAPIFYPLCLSQGKKPPSDRQGFCLTFLRFHTLSPKSTPPWGTIQNCYHSSFAESWLIPSVKRLSVRLPCKEG